MNLKDSDLERIFKAFANKRRIAVIRCLIKRKQMTVGQISEEIKLSFKSTSRHLTVMRAAGIIDKEQKSLEMHYFLSTDTSHMAKVIIANF